MDEFEEEKRASGIDAWWGYYVKMRQNDYIYFLHRKGQRRVKCRECGVIVPKELPRVRVISNWSYDNGHYCMDCALTIIREKIWREQEIIQDLQDNVQRLKKMLEQVRQTKEKESYKQKIALGRLCAKLER